MNRFILLSLVLLCGCKSVRQAEVPTGPHCRVLTYNVNWGGPRADLAADIIRQSKADIVCLQETNPFWEKYLREKLAREYPFAEFRESKGRMGGGLAFLSKLPAREVDYVPSNTGWFDGWIMRFETAIGSVQVLNVHLRPPLSDSGSWTRGYFTTRDDRLRELARFYARGVPNVPMIVAGDFNDTQRSQTVRWLEKHGMINALPEFDRRTPTWQLRYHFVHVNRRMDHIIYAPPLHCCSARVIQSGASDHFPVEAVFAKGK